jgi:hypothetical protein
MWRKRIKAGDRAWLCLLYIPLSNLLLHSGIISPHETSKIMSATPGTMTPLPPLSTRTSFTRVETDYDETQSALVAAAAAIGEHNAIPSTMSAAEAQDQQDPQTTITFLLVTGRRRTMSFDPTASVARVKELVWNSWPQGL